MKEKTLSHKKPLILIALAVVILFCLWFTRPQNWSDLSGDYGAPREINANLTLWEFSGPSSPTTQHYTLEVDGTSDAAKELLDLLEENRYRLMLRSLFPINALEGGDYEGLEINAAILGVNLIYEDTAISMGFQGDRLSFIDLQGNGMDAYTIQDPTISDDLSRLIMAYGVPDEEN